MSRRLFVLGVTGVLVGCGAHVRPSVAPPPPSFLPARQLTSLSLPSVSLVLDPAISIVAGADWACAHESLELHAGDVFAEPQSEPAAIDSLLQVGETARSLAPGRTTAEIVAADLLNTPHDLAITANEKVLSYVELFQTELKSFVEDGLARGSRYLPMIQEVLQAEGLPLDVAYVPLIESAFKPTALSRAKAKGLWQFMAGTARELGLRQTRFLDERSDPEKATRAAAKYLKTLCRLFAGDWNLALAAYNAGMGRVRRAMKQAHETEYWALAASTRYLPRETREYVPMILAAIIIARNPAQYGFEIGPVEPLEYDTVNVPEALRLDRVAEWLNVSADEIQALNPELRREMTPIGRYELKVPLGSAPIVERQLASAPRSVFALQVSKAATPAAYSAASGGAATYRVKRGDTLYRIARQFDTSVEGLRALNQLPADAIAVGDKLMVRR